MCKVVKCESPIPKNGVLLSGHKTQFYYQDTVQLGCKEGFDLQGSKTVVCGANNNWEPQLPQCTEGTSPPAPPSPPTDSLGGGVIAAIVISVVAVLAVIGSYFLYRHKKKGKTEVNAEYRPCQDKSSTPAEHEVVSPKLA